ncbi:MAG: leucine--tRNA ligase [Planctomycetes bacterium]|nr:leucine--tRNA ligase [Planctomycetota bacterium]
MDFKITDQKWLKYWHDNDLYSTPSNPQNHAYYLEMFAYPSGDIHMGHFRNYTIGDVIYRYKRLQGQHLLHPFGWDAFGLPAEQAAIKRNIHPRDWTINNINTGRITLKKMGLSYDWSREILTCNPDYYKWTQWLFLLLYRNGLAYQSKSNVNWCDNCKTVLANEQAESGRCWRCHGNVTKKELDNCWFFKITDYADRLLKDLDKLDQWPENVKTIQKNWIGKSEGVEIDFKIAGTDRIVTIFTTRLDTIFGVTFLSVAPEYSKIIELIPHGKQAEVNSYIKASISKSEIDRTSTQNKNGVFTELYAINPFNNKKVPIWISDYVLMSYGTGAVMGVPAHDERDFQFAKTYSLDISQVIKSQETIQKECFVNDGLLINSEQFNNLTSPEARAQMVNYAVDKGFGRQKINYKIRDWLISRQRYWGAPIPILYCKKCGITPVSEKDLPVLLPDDVKEFTPKGRSPLEDSAQFKNAICSKCGREANRCVDTMDTFVDSSFYMFRYLDPKSNENPWGLSEAKKWLPINLYIGGIEHASGHLLYFRFITKVLYDAGMIPVDEPVVRLFNHGMVLDKAGDIMSKSKGNVVAPGDLLEEFGIDVSRLTMFFAAPSNQEVKWNPDFIKGITRFYNRFIFNLSELIDKISSIKLTNDGQLSDNFVQLKRKTHLHTKRATASLENDFAFNTAIASIMELLNLYEELKPDLIPVNKNELETLKEFITTSIITIAPFAPIIAEELWEQMGYKPSILEHAKWPKSSTEWAVESRQEIPIQIDGKVRAQIPIEQDQNDDFLKKNCMASEKVKKYIEQRQVAKFFIVRDKQTNSPKLISIVTK